MQITDPTTAATTATINVVTQQLHTMQLKKAK